jgi:hypothetical protein
MSRYPRAVYEWTDVSRPVPAALALPEERAAFIRRVYGHVAGALLAFVAIEFLLLVPFRPFSEQFVQTVLAGGRLGWLLVLGAFIAVAWVAEKWAMSDASQGVQYLGLALYTVAEALICLPLLFLVVHVLKEPALVQQAAILTLALFAALTACVLTTRTDFHFLGPILWMLSFLALGTIVAALLFGFTLGIWFVVAMIALVGASILYQTSNVLHYYRTDQHVAAALGLFASVVTLFYYILVLLLKQRN